MKFKVLFTSILFFQSAVFACLDLGGSLKICAGDTIYNDRVHKLQAVGLSQKSNSVLAKDYKDQSVPYKVQDLFASRGCRHDVCIDDTVYFRDRDLYAPLRASKIVAIRTQFASVVLIDGDNKPEGYSVDDLYTTTGYNEYVSVGDTVYHGLVFPQGAKVVAVSKKSKKLVIVQDNSTSSLQLYRADYLDVFK
ncbi:MAG: hypothetical protein V4654_05750 [Bdellovibrionota bacterium]